MKISVDKNYDSVLMYRYLNFLVGNTSVFLAGILVFLGINFVNSPRAVSIPRDKGVMSDNLIPVMLPDRIPPYIIDNHSNHYYSYAVRVPGWLLQWLLLHQGPPTSLEIFRKNPALLFVPSGIEGWDIVHNLYSYVIPMAFGSPLL